MEVFAKYLLASRSVTVWGAGYLGYTEALRMQAKGFFVTLWDNLPERLEALRQGEYPSQDIKEEWSLGSAIPFLDTQRLCLAQSFDKALDSPVHILCVPSENHLLYQNILQAMLPVLQRPDALVLFVSPNVPGTIDTLLANFPTDSIHCAIATAFREDWYVEEMFTEGAKRISGTNNAHSAESADMFFRMTGQTTLHVQTIKCAEVLVHSRQVMQSFTSTFLNQLALAFADVDIRQLGVYLVNVSPRLQMPTFGHTDIRQTMALSFLSSDSHAASVLTLPQEIQRVGLATLLAYADMLIAHNVKKIALLGLSPLLSASRDARMSPPIILADYFHRHGVEVYVHDPAYSCERVQSLMSYAQYWNMEYALDVDAVCVMRDIASCRNLSQTDVERLGITAARFVLDNVGLFAYYTFPNACLYHVPGDGSLSRLECAL